MRLGSRSKGNPVTNPKVSAILRSVAAHFDVPLERLTDKRGRQQHITYARHAAMVLIHRLNSSMSLTDIGDAMGGYDHTTVLHAIRRITKKPVALQRAIAELEAMFRPSRLVHPASGASLRLHEDTERARGVIES